MFFFGIYCTVFRFSNNSLFEKTLIFVDFSLFLELCLGFHNEKTSDDDALASVFSKKNKRAPPRDQNVTDQVTAATEKVPKQRAPRPQTSLVKIETDEEI